MLSSRVTDQPTPGFVGGTVLSKLLSHPRVGAHRLTVFVRSEEKARVLQEQFHVKAAVGSFDDAEQLTRLASQADVIFSCVSSRMGFRTGHDSLMSGWIEGRNLGQSPSDARRPPRATAKA